MQNATASYLHHVSALHNNSVGFLPRSFLPVLWGRGGKPIFLYQFIEEWEEATDYEELAKNLPELSSGQIASAFAFLRGLAQFNIRGIDLDEIASQEIEASSAFKAIIREHLEETESPLACRITP